ncbi:hypothetical protein PC129_g4098 [Phytophthora cactorum]|uniref:Uncharacterized protein n=1 Tax=Phytophthora cactorum TaxID=29920 RepID=A0A329SRU4_9STRA|nr:hypothetical protein Pcac1_g13702 [Phytophthora cactorum]KAG2830279.1 hypothetical protein PC111_g7437 [Phytophthora cactorum]KAG2862561.1 hypothetical protein PC113_g6193 [Phytophthora cactorum]KAG2919460.1 hypothetical protein PC114_g6470 [Phytophthora cactorum]KAG2992814.1 hypothetical protein PC118_g4365 [Phytophthora cactorum]
MLNSVTLSLMASTLESMLAQLLSTSERLGRIEDVQAKLPILPPRDEIAHERLSQPSMEVESVVPPPAIATKLARCYLNWYTNHIWQAAKGKKVHNQRAEANAAVNIMMVLYQQPFEVPDEPSRADSTAYQDWMRLIWELSLNATANQRLHTFDIKQPTRKVSYLRKRWRQLRASNPDAYHRLHLNTLP